MVPPPPRLTITFTADHARSQPTGHGLQCCGRTRVGHVRQHVRLARRAGELRGAGACGGISAGWVGLVLPLLLKVYLGRKFVESGETLETRMSEAGVVLRPGLRCLGTVMAGIRFVQAWLSEAELVYRYGLFAVLVGVLGKVYLDMSLALCSSLFPYFLRIVTPVKKLRFARLLCFSIPLGSGGRYV